MSDSMLKTGFNMLFCDDFMSSGQRVHCPACLHLPHTHTLKSTHTHTLFLLMCHCELTLLMCEFTLMSRTSLKLAVGDARQGCSVKYQDMIMGTRAGLVYILVDTALSHCG